MTKEKRALIIQKGEALKKKLKSENPRRYLADFHANELADVEISYFHFCNILKGRYDRDRDDVFEIIDKYLGE